MGNPSLSKGWNIKPPLSKGGRKGPRRHRCPKCRKFRSRLKKGICEWCLNKGKTK